MEGELTPPHNGEVGPPPPSFWSCVRKVPSRPKVLNNNFNLKLARLEKREGEVGPQDESTLPPTPKGFLGIPGSESIAQVFA